MGAALGSTSDEPVPTGCVPVAVPGRGNVPLDRGNGAEDAVGNGFGPPVPVPGYGVVAFGRGNGAEDERSEVGRGPIDPVPGLVPVPLVRAGNVVSG